MSRPISLFQTGSYCHTATVISVWNLEISRLLQAWQFVKRFHSLSVCGLLTVEGWHYRLHACTYCPWAWHMLNCYRKQTLSSACGHMFHLLIWLMLLTIIPWWLQHCHVPIWHVRKKPFVQEVRATYISTHFFYGYLLWCFIYWHITCVAEHMCFSVLPCIKNWLLK